MDFRPRRSAAEIAAEIAEAKFSRKVSTAQGLCRGVVAEVTNFSQASAANNAGACAVVVSAPRGEGISRMADPNMIEFLRHAVTIPAMARVRVGHIAEAQIVDSIPGIDFIDECEVTGIADANNFINKHDFVAAFVCGCRDLGEALRRISEGAAMVRAQGVTDELMGKLSETVRCVRKLMGEIRDLIGMDEDEVFAFSQRIGAPYDAVCATRREGKLRVPVFAAGGITTVADAALMMHLGCDGVFLDQEIFLGEEEFEYKEAQEQIKAIVEGVKKYRNTTELGLASKRFYLDDYLYDSAVTRNHSRLDGGVVVVAYSEQGAKFAEWAKASGVCFSDRNPFLIKKIKEALTIPVIAKVRAGHFVEAQILESIGFEFLDENDKFGIADESNFIKKHDFKAKFFCGCRDLGEALRRISEGSSAIRIQGDRSGWGDVATTVLSVRKLMDEIRALNAMDEAEVHAFSERIKVPYDIVSRTKQLGRLPVPQFADGGIVFPADAVLMMRLGCDGVFLGPEIWGYNSKPYARVLSIVHSVKYYKDAAALELATRRLKDYRDWLTQEARDQLAEEE